VDDGSTSLIILAGLLGLIFGSFGTVVAYRVPRRASIVYGRSRCPNCDRQLRAIENIPVVSYVLQRGRCRGCGTAISIRYPLIELATGALFALAAAKFGLTIEGVVFAACFWVLVVLSVIDLEHRLLPDRIVYPAFVAAWVGLTVAAVVDDDLDRLLDAALGAVVFGGFFFIVAFLFPAGMGGGDVKLAFVLGTFTGYLGGMGVTLVGMFLSFALGSIVGVAVMLVGGGGRKTMVPFGPFLALGTIISIFVGQSIVDWYVGRL